jgi:hypothetical protein
MRKIFVDTDIITDGSSRSLRTMAVSLALPLLLCVPSHVVLPAYQNTVMPEGGLFVAPVRTVGFVNEEHLAMFEMYILAELESTGAFDTVFTNDRFACTDTLTYEGEYMKLEATFSVPSACAREMARYLLVVKDADFNLREHDLEHFRPPMPMPVHPPQPRFPLRSTSFAPGGNGPFHGGPRFSGSASTPVSWGTALGAGKTRSFDLSATYLFWDTATDSAICYGSVGATLPTLFGYVHEDAIEEGIRSLCSLLVSRTPFAP